MVLALTTGAFVVGASTAQEPPVGYYFNELNSQFFSYISDARTTSSNEFQPLRELSFDEINQFGAKGPFTVTLNVQVEGAPAEFRIVSSGEQMKPGPVIFDPRGGTETGSFAFGYRGTKRRACHHYLVEWRSPTGAPTQLIKGSAGLVLRVPEKPVACA